jgi:integrase
LLLGLRNGEVVGCLIRDLDEAINMLWIAASKTEAGIPRVEVPDVLQPTLLKVAGGRNGTEALFPGFTRNEMPYWTKTPCPKLGLPIISPRGLRGTHATATTSWPMQLCH